MTTLIGRNIWIVSRDIAYAARVESECGTGSGTYYRVVDQFGTRTEVPVGHVAVTHGDAVSMIRVRAEYWQQKLAEVLASES